MTADQQKIPSWSAFNTMVSCEALSTTEVGYCPMINGTSTDYNTVYTVMKQVQQMMSSIGQEYSVVTFDLAIYMKAKEIQWCHPEEFDDTVIRMGGFHIAPNYLAVIGKMFRDSELLDLIIESDIYGCSTASHLLEGKTYNREVRCHKLVMEALSRIQYQEVCKWISTTRNDIHLPDQTCITEHIRDCNLAEEAVSENLSESCQVVVYDMKEVRSQLVYKHVFAHVT